MPIISNWDRWRLHRYRLICSPKMPSWKQLNWKPRVMQDWDDEAYASILDDESEEVAAEPAVFSDLPQIGDQTARFSPPSFQSAQLPSPDSEVDDILEGTGPPAPHLRAKRITAVAGEATEAAQPDFPIHPVLGLEVSSILKAAADRLASGSISPRSATPSNKELEARLALFTSYRNYQECYPCPVSCRLNAYCHSGDRWIRTKRAYRTVKPLARRRRPGRCHRPEIRSNPGHEPARQRRYGGCRSNFRSGPSAEDYDCLVLPGGVANPDACAPDRDAPSIL